MAREGPRGPCSRSRVDQVPNTRPQSSLSDPASTNRDQSVGTLGG
jgi:hypothetical protein